MEIAAMIYRAYRQSTTHFSLSKKARPPEESVKSAPAPLDLESLVEQLQKSPELASALAALIAAQTPGKVIRKIELAKRRIFLANF